jgi:hypothetical protein
MKTQILAALGESGLQQASALNAGLAVNDRIKYDFSLLQMAIEHARRGGGWLFSCESIPSGS